MSRNKIYSRETKLHNPTVRFDEKKFPSKADQSFEKESNVNEIMAKWSKTGQLTHIGQPGVYADVSNLGDFQEAMQTVTKAQQDFEQLSPLLRERFNQSPVQLVNFLRDPKNREEAQKLGLIPIPESKIQYGTIPMESSGDKAQAASGTPTKKQKQQTQHAEISGDE